VGADGGPSAIPGSRTRKKCAGYLHSSFLNKVERTVQSRSTDRGYKGSGVQLSTFDAFDFDTSHNESAYRFLPRAAFGYDLLKAAALIWAQRMRLQSSISLLYKEFHLAHQMPL
jgi:hypothetical protein